jgi:hypothetical protein
MRLAFVFISLLFAGLSCKKGVAEPSPHINMLSAKVNGLPHESQNNNVEVNFSLSPMVGARAVGVHATASNDKEIYLLMKDYDGTSKSFTDDLNDPNAIGGFATMQGLNHTSYSTVGEIKLTAIDKDTYETGDVANGTFHFDTDTTAGFFSVTDGSFSIFISH